MKNLLALLLVFCLSGCFSGSPNATFYNLSPAEVSGIKANPKPRFSVGIEKVVMPDYLKKPQIVTKDKDNYELTQSEFNRWGESLSGMMQRTIALDIAQYLPNATVKPKGYITEEFDYTVLVEVTDFGGTFGDKAVLNAWWTVFDINGDSILRKNAKLSAPLGQGYNALAAQQSILLGELSADIYKSLLKLK